MKLLDLFVIGLMLGLVLGAEWQNHRRTMREIDRKTQEIRELYNAIIVEQQASCSNALESLKASRRMNHK